MSENSMNPRPLFDHSRAPARVGGHSMAAPWRPLRNGNPVDGTLDSTNRQVQIEWQFLSAYAQINRLADAIESATDDAVGEPLLEELEGWLAYRDALESYYHAEGVIAEPVHRNGQVINVEFRYGALFKTPNADRVGPVFEARISL